jgi:dual specificity MAP kinase phosphatase
LFEYHTVASAPPPLDECVAFIERVRARGGRVLVHCMTGASRAPAVAAAYLMRARGARLDAAYAALAAAVPALALSAADAARLEAEEAAALGPAASGFRVPVGRQPPAAAPLGWAGAAPPAVAPAPPAVAPAPPGGGGAPAAPGFVFGAQ